MASTNSRKRKIEQTDEDLADAMASENHAEIDAQTSKDRNHAIRHEFSLCCAICNLSFTSASHAKSHFQGGKHAKSRRQMGEEEEERTCNICQITLNSAFQRETHFDGNQHRENVTKMMGGQPTTKPPPLSSLPSVFPPTPRLSSKSQNPPIPTMDGEIPSHCVTSKLSIHPRLQLTPPPVLTTTGSRLSDALDRCSNSSFSSDFVTPPSSPVRATPFSRLSRPEESLLSTLSSTQRLTNASLSSTQRESSSKFSDQHEALSKITHQDTRCSEFINHLQQQQQQQQQQQRLYASLTDSPPNNVDEDENPRRCECCEVSYTSEAHRQQHIAGRKHKNNKQLLMAQKVSQTYKYGEDDEVDDWKEEFELKCGICDDLDFPTATAYAIHMKSQRHRNKVFELKRSATDKNQPKLDSPEKSTKSPRKKALERDPTILKEIIFHPKDYPVQFEKL